MHGMQGSSAPDPFRAMFQPTPFHNPTSMLLPLLPSFVSPPQAFAPSAVGTKRHWCEVEDGEDTSPQMMMETPRSAPRVTFASHASSRGYQYEALPRSAGPVDEHNADDASDEGEHRTSDQVEQEAAVQSPRSAEGEAPSVASDQAEQDAALHSPRSVASSSPSVMAEYCDEARPTNLSDGPSEEVLVLGRVVQAALSTGSLVKSTHLILALVGANRVDLIAGMHVRLGEVIARLNNPDFISHNIRVAPNKAIKVPRACVLQMASLAAIAAAFLPVPSAPDTNFADGQPDTTFADGHPDNLSPRALPPACAECGGLLRVLPVQAQGLSGRSVCATCAAS